MLNVLITSGIGTSNSVIVRVGKNLVEVKNIVVRLLEVLGQLIWQNVYPLVVVPDLNLPISVLIPRLYI